MTAQPPTFALCTARLVYTGQGFLYCCPCTQPWGGVLLLLVGSRPASGFLSIYHFLMTATFFHHEFHNTWKRQQYSPSNMFLKSLLLGASMLGANVVAQSSTASSTAPGQTHIFSVGAVCTGFSFIETYTDVRQNGKTFTPNKLDIPVGDIAGRYTTQFHQAC